MTSPRPRRSKNGSTDDARVGRERALVAREGAVVRREHALGLQAATDRASHLQAQAGAVKLIDQVRAVNERLIVAALHAQNLSDEAHTETAQARDEVDHLLNELQSANERLAAGAAYAHTMAEDARAHEEQYRRLSSRLLVVQDEERRRLALDLHDPIGQHLAALAIQLDLIEQRATTLDAGSRRALAESRSLADQCAREVRTFAYLLHPPMLDELGLRAAVRWYAEGFTKRSGIQVVVELADVGRLSRPIETALFRVVQESLTNVHRHASSSATAAIRLTVAAGVVALEVQNHGQRPDRTAQQAGTVQPATLGVGIQGMRERIRQLGGTFDIEFTDEGTTVRVGVPLNADAA